MSCNTPTPASCGLTPPPHLSPVELPRLLERLNRIAPGVRIRICDNGGGFDTQLLRRGGLNSMHERAQALGAQLNFQSRPGETVVELLLH